MGTDREHQEINWPYRLLDQAHECEGGNLSNIMQLLFFKCEETAWTLSRTFPSDRLDYSVNISVPWVFYALGHRNYICTAIFSSVRALPLALWPVAWPRLVPAMCLQREQLPPGSLLEIVPSLCWLLGIVQRNTSWPRSKSGWETCYEYTESVWALELIKLLA